MENPIKQPLDLPGGFDGTANDGEGVVATQGGGKKRGLVGIRNNEAAIVAWDLYNGKNIQVDALKMSERAWHIDGYAAGTLRISATVFGGLNATKRYVKAIRSGLMSRVMRRKHGAKKEGK